MSAGVVREGKVELSAGVVSGQDRVEFSKLCKDIEGIFQDTFTASSASLMVGQIRFYCHQNSRGRALGGRLYLRVY